MALDLPIPREFVGADFPGNETVWDFASKFLMTYAHSSPFEYGNVRITARQVHIRWTVIRNAYLRGRERTLRGSPYAMSDWPSQDAVNKIIFPTEEILALADQTLRGVNVGLGAIRHSLVSINRLVHTHEERLSIQRDCINVLTHATNDATAILRSLTDIILNRTTPGRQSQTNASRFDS